LKKSVIEEERYIIYRSSGASTLGEYSFPQLVLQTYAMGYKHYLSFEDLEMIYATTTL
jgi:hypothetical protein